MKLKETLTIVITTCGAAEITQAISAIDFVNRDGNAPTYQSVQCVAAHRRGQSITVQGQQQYKASSVNLKSLLAGAEGEYKIQCTAIHRKSGVVYQIEFEAVKFKEGEFGSDAPRYDANQLAYGVKVPLSKTINSCYDPAQIAYREGCLRTYYGQKQYYAKVVPGPRTIQYRYHPYASNIGVFLKENPRYVKNNSEE